MRARTWTLAALAALAVAAPAAQAAPGDLDSSFGSGGKKTFNFATDDAAFAVQVQPDGKLVLAGFAGIDLAAVRLTPDGNLDPSFGGSGLAPFNFGVNAVARALALQPDGKVVLAGQTSVSGGGDDIALARLNANGTPDGTFFNATGRRTYNVDGADGAAAVALQKDGIVVVGHDGGTNVNMIQARFSTDGVIDSLFGSFGVSGQDLGGSEYGFGAAVDATDRIVSVGSSSRESEIAISRVNANGSPDTTLELDGNLSLSLGGSDIGEAVAIQPDGKIVLTGTGGPGSDLFVMRLTSAFQTDTSFTGDGVAELDFGGVDYGRALALQANGKIVVAGSSGGGDMVVARFQPNGLVDTTFGDNGKRTIDFGGLDTAYGVALQADGKIVVAGATGGDVAVARLDGDEPATGGGPTGGPGGGAGKTKVLRCNGKRATVIGTNRRNRLKGTKRADVIVALGGNDTIDGKGGNDVICAGDGNDKANGGDGNDRVFGGNGNDAISGGAGKDRMAGQNGKDKLTGGPNDDSLDGGPGNDRLYGQGGKDTLLGRAGKDSLAGGPGKDKQKQ